jgi:hypothetical protein
MAVAAHGLICVAQNPQAVNFGSRYVMLPNSKAQTSTRHVARRPGQPLQAHVTPPVDFLFSTVHS